MPPRTDDTYTLEIVRGETVVLDLTLQAREGSEVVAEDLTGATIELDVASAAESIVLHLVSGVDAAVEIVDAERGEIRVTLERDVTSTPAAGTGRSAVWWTTADYDRTPILSGPCVVTDLPGGV